MDFFQGRCFKIKRFDRIITKINIFDFLVASQFKGSETIIVEVKLLDILYFAKSE